MRNPRTNQSQLIKCLIEAGIQPSSFAYFLMQYVKKKPSKRTTLSILLDAQLKSQAKIILYHMTH